MLASINLIPTKTPPKVATIFGPNLSCNLPAGTHHNRKYQTNYCIKKLYGHQSITIPLNADFEETPL
jgi:hypothetical protein